MQRGTERRRVLIVRTGAMGDVVHALPAVAALRAARPEWEIGWAIEPHWADLLESEGWAGVRGRGAGRPLVDRVHRVPIRAWKRSLWRWETVRDVMALRRELRAARYDLCVDLQGLIRSALIGSMAGAGRFVGMERPREAPAAWFYGQRVRTKSAHVVERGCEIVQAATGVTLGPGQVELPIAAEAWAEEFVRGIPGSEGKVLLAATAGWGAKVWPAERYGLVAAGLARAGYGCVVNAVRADEATARAVVEASGGRAVVAAGSVSGLIALMRRVDLVIAGDTGPLHLAAALGVPVVGLFGPTDPRRNGPYGTRAVVLRHPSSVQDHRRWPETEAGLLQIEPEEVVVAALGLLSETERGRNGTVA